MTKAKPISDNLMATESKSDPNSSSKGGASMTGLKAIASRHHEPSPHWVGDGFPVRTLFSHDCLGARISPFLLLDYAGPAQFRPSEAPRGVDEHPHRGFETVTIVYEGELEHRDSAGNSGSIGPGDVQWMTAASGVVHEEKHSEDFTKRGGTLEMVQLWVNLPAEFKMSPPHYQTLLNADIPAVQTSDGRGTVRIIAGTFQGKKGPARTFTPINVWDVRLQAGAAVDFTVPAGFNTAVVLLRGSVKVNDSHEPSQGSEMILFDREGERVRIAADEASILLVLSGQPINEPVAAYGPFVMNTEKEIRQAMDDYRNARMGTLDLRIKAPTRS